MFKKLLLIIIVLGFLNPYPVSAQSKSERVFEICGCLFPAEIGAYKHLKATKVRYTLFRQIPWTPLMIREIIAERRGEKYRIISLVISTESSSVGNNGPIIEIVKLNGPYWPGKVIYQLTLDQIYYEYQRINE